MKSVLSIFLLVSFVSCSQQTFKYVVDNREKSYTYKYIVPIGFTFYGWSGGYEDEKQYWYSDSSVFYITKAKGLTLINAENVRAIPGAYSKLLLTDTISLQGIDSKNLYWKHIKL